ncbi:hypothetical protein AVEN_87986-1 [Araneus ventricosus]|uniref:Uncharacterized protein n=1 Tax=Araneus ventricosus TaxID=182803 RepID=A0A4Y2QH46_ARAVE|nr:hypothetical protein AVEN_87986-1 [Araneus ventricosus]
MRGRIHPTRQLSTHPYPVRRSQPTVVQLTMTLGQQRHISGMPCCTVPIQRCPLNCVVPETSALESCIVLGCQLSHRLAPILLSTKRDSSLDILFLDDAWTTNT